MNITISDKKDINIYLNIWRFFSSQFSFLMYISCTWSRVFVWSPYITFMLFLFMCVLYCILKQCASKLCNFIGYIWSTFLHCEFSNVSSNGLREMMQSHTGCICLAFLHCEFSNVSSNPLLEQMHSHIGCIGSTFLHCVFSNVSSDRLLEKRQRHIGCICLAFLHCEFSNVSSNGFCEKMHNHIDCIYLTWWRCQSFSSWFLNQSNNFPLPLYVVLCPNDCFKLKTKN